MTTKAKIVQVSIDSYNIYKYTKYTTPSIYIDNVLVFPESVGIFVKSCSSFEEARMIIDLNGWTYVEKLNPIVISKSEYRKKYRKDKTIGYDDLDKILVDNGYEKFFTRQFIFLIDF